MFAGETGSYLDGSALQRRREGDRMEDLLALRWREVNFAGSVVRARSSYEGGSLNRPRVDVYDGPCSERSLVARATEPGGRADGQVSTSG